MILKEIKNEANCCSFSFSSLNEHIITHHVSRMLNFKEERNITQEKNVAHVLIIY